MNIGPTDPYTTGFGAVPRPEEPERPSWAPPEPVHAPYAPTPGYAATVGYRQLSPNAQAFATNVNNIRITGGGYGYRRCNHALHATLTVLTCGLWAPVWFVAWLVAKDRAR